VVETVKKEFMPMKVDLTRKGDKAYEKLVKE